MMLHLRPAAEYLQTVSCHVTMQQGEGSSVAPEQQLKLAMFGSVPLADLELVLPHKKVGDT